MDGETRGPLLAGAARGYFLSIAYVLGFYQFE